MSAAAMAAPAPVGVVVIMGAAALLYGGAYALVKLIDRPEKRAPASPPAGLHPPFAPAGVVPGPASAMGADGGSPAAVHAPGPGTRNGPPWEMACHDPGHWHDPALWPVEDDHIIPIGSQR